MQLRRERQFTAFFKKVLRSKRVDVDAMEDALWEQLEGVRDLVPKRNREACFPECFPPRSVDVFFWVIAGCRASGLSQRQMRMRKWESTLPRI